MITVTTQYVIDLFKRIKYKNSYSFDIHTIGVPSDLHTQISIRCRTWDSHTGDPTQIGLTLVLNNQYPNEESIVQEIFDFLLSFERHEVGELFLLDGKRVFDPHKPNLPIPNLAKVFNSFSDWERKRYTLRNIWHTISERLF